MTIDQLIIFLCVSCGLGFCIGLMYSFWKKDKLIVELERQIEILRKRTNDLVKGDIVKDDMR